MPCSTGCRRCPSRRSPSCTASALGGGFELALACDHRIAVDGASFGFPEVRLGLHPGLGGSYRLTALIDPVEAMTMMLTGRTAHTARARKLGIVDAVTEERHVQAAVRAAAAGELGRREPGLKARAFALQPARALCRAADAAEDRRAGAAGALSSSLRADRPLGGGTAATATPCSGARSSRSPA